MADQELGLKIKTDSDVPEAMGKAQKATVSFGKQVEDIQKKFSTAFKDVFLSFLGPMALLGIALNYISKLIADNQRKHAEANQAAIDGTNELMSAEDRYWANKTNNEKKAKETVEQAKTTREDVTKSFLQNDPRGRAMLFEFSEQQRKLGSSKYGVGYASEDKAMQERVQKLIAEDAKKNPDAGVNSKDSTLKTSAYQAPAGVNAIVGMGNNAAMDALNAQLEENRKQTALLEQIANSGSYTPPDFTKPTSAAPSRSAYLKK